MAPKPGAREAIQLLASALRNSSDVRLVGAIAITEPESTLLTWVFTGDPTLAQTTFGVIAAGYSVNLKFDCTDLTACSVFNLATSHNEYVPLNYLYDNTIFTAEVPTSVVDLSTADTFRFNITANAVSRGVATVEPTYN